MGVSSRALHWVLDGHGFDIIGSIIGNVTFSEYMGAI